MPVKVEGESGSTKEILPKMATAGARRSSTSNKQQLVYKDNVDGSRTVLCKTAGNYTMNGLRQFRQNRNMCDVIFQVEGGEVLAHRNVLMVHSTYFLAMFSEGFHETHAREIPLLDGDVDRDSAESLVNYMYTGQLCVTPDRVQSLIVAADLWQMLEVKHMCAGYMERQIDEQNCLGVLTFGRMYRCDNLELKSLQLIKQRFPLVVQSGEFLHQSAELLDEILSFTDLTLGLDGEDVVVKGVLRWLQYNPQQREAHLPALLKKTHLGRASKACKKLLQESIQHLHDKEEICQLIERLMDERQSVRSAQTTLYVIGGFLQSRTGPKCPRLQSVERLDSVTGQWTACADLPMLSSGSVAFSLHGHLFCAAFEPITAGNNISVTETGIFEYNPLRDEWQDAKPSFSPEALECIDNCLQAQGAIAVCPNTHSIYTVSHSEVSCISVNVIDGDIYCRQVRLLPRPREYFTEQQCLHSAVVVDGSLYVLGGDRHDWGSEPVPTARVIALDLLTHRWASRANMLETRVKLSAVTLNGYIYVCGGFNVRRLASVERYDPTTDTWTALQPMEKYRSHHEMLVLHNKIWAIGGKSYAVSNGGARKVLNMCEVYDPDTDTWTEGQAMKFARCGFAAVAI